MDFTISGIVLERFAEFINRPVRVGEKLVVQASQTQLELHNLDQSIRFQSSELDAYTVPGSQAHFTIPLKDICSSLSRHIPNTERIKVEFPDHHDAYELVIWTLEHNDSCARRKKTYWITCSNKVGSIEAGSIGAGNKKKNKKSQLQQQAALKIAEASSSKTPKKPRQTFEQLFGLLHPLLKDWSREDGLIISEVRNQKDEDINIWAIVISRIVQAIHNHNSHISQHLEFSVEELVQRIKPEPKKALELRNLKIAFKHVEEKGVLKKSVGNRTQSVESKGNRVYMPLTVKRNVDARFIQEKLNQHPVGLILEVEPKFIEYKGQEFYNLPKKNIPHKALHCILLIGHGVTEKNEIYFIGQNSYGDTWGCKGFIKMMINNKCDIICLKE